MVMRAIKLVLLKMTLNLIKQLQTGNPNKISLLNQYITENYLKVERWLHRKHSSSKSEAKNEWRMLTDEQVFSFITDCEIADDNIKFLFEHSLFE
jgi:hypothetical protein